MSGAVIFRTQEEAASLKITISDPVRAKADFNILMRVISSSAHRFFKLKKTHKFIDKHLTPSAQEASVCRVGCNHCCAIDVDVLHVEAEYIAKKTGMVINPDISKRAKTGYHLLPKKEALCRFNIDGMCSIYKFRPIECRSFFALDNPEYCENGTDHHILGAKSSSGTMQILSQLIKSTNENVADIREWFIWQT